MTMTLGGFTMVYQIQEQLVEMAAWNMAEVPCLYSHLTSILRD